MFNMKKKIKPNQIRTLADAKQYKEEQQNSYNFRKKCIPIFLLQLVFALLDVFPSVREHLGVITTFIYNDIVQVIFLVSLLFSCVVVFKSAKDILGKVVEVCCIFPIIGFILGLVFGLYALVLLFLFPIIPGLYDLYVRKKALDIIDICIKDYEVLEDEIEQENAKQELINELLNAYKTGRIKTITSSKEDDS